MKGYGLAKIAYDAYCRATGGVSLISGDQLPEFERLRESIRDAWWEAAEAVRTECKQDTEWKWMY